MTDKSDGVSLAPNKGGRPRILTPTAEILKQVDGLGRIQCTTREGAAFFRVSEPTFLKFLADDPDAKEAFEDGKGSGCVSLLRTQFELSKKNAAVCIFLGKQYLGQTDRQDHRLTGADGGPVQYANLSEEEINARLAALAAKHGSAPASD
jgi:hypothetical protein